MLGREFSSEDCCTREAWDYQAVVPVVRGAVQVVIKSSKLWGSPKIWDEERDLLLGFTAITLNVGDHSLNTYHMPQSEIETMQVGRLG